MALKEICLEPNLKDLTDIEVLSLLLDVESDVLSQKVTLSQVLYSNPLEVSKKLGLERDKTIKIESLQEVIKRVKKGNRNIQKIRSSRDVFDLFCEELKGKKQEHVFLLTLDSSNNIIDKTLLYIGTLNEVIIHPREILRILFKVSPASFILVHNHPSGDPAPSEKDKKITLRIKKIANLVKIPLVDHVILGYGTYFSFRDLGMI